MKKIVFFSAFIIALTAIFSCKKGDTGPAGPAGTAGANGTNGTNGATGATGDTGTTNVIYSDWITKVQADWTGIGTAVIATNITATELTDDIKDRGMILVYQDFAGSVKLLPYAYSSTGDHFDFTFGTGLIALRDYHQDASTFSGIPDMSFRYVLVPANVIDGRTMQPANEKINRAQLQNMSYAELVKLFNIPGNGTNSR
jgi:hypothetical protein